MNKEKHKTSLRHNIAVKITVGMLVMMILLSVIALVIAYAQFSEEFTQEYQDNAFRIARAAQSYIKEENLDEYLESEEESEEYQRTYKQLTTLCNKVNAQFIYVIQPDTTDYEHITFIFNTVNENSGFEPYARGTVRETTNEEYVGKYQLMYAGLSDQETVVRDKGFIETGAHITAMLPLHDESGRTNGILCVQRQMDALSTARVSYTVKMLIALTLLIVFVTCLSAFFLRRNLISPLRRITAETQRFSKNPGSEPDGLSDYVKIKNEIGILAQSVNKMEEDTIQYIDDITAMTAEKHRIGTELTVASAIQQSLLNSVSPGREEFDICAEMIPAKEVGGDFYDFFMIDDDHLCMVMADVSGKGVPAAMFMTISKVIISDSAMVCSSPASILGFVNKRICKKNELDMFVTVWLGILEISTGKVTASSAGHEYPAVFRKGKGFELLKDKHGFVVGGMENVKYTDYTIQLEEGDSLFLYTDGVAEATDREEQLFGTQRMLDALNTEPDAAPHQVMDNVKAAVDRFVGEAPQFDDLTMMCMKYYGDNKKKEG